MKQRRKRGVWLKLAVLLLALFFPGKLKANPDSLQDFSQAALVSPPDLGRVEQNALRMLVEEVEKRTLIRVQPTQQWPAQAIPVIAVGTLARLQDFSGPLNLSASQLSDLPPEGYLLKTGKTSWNAPAAWVIGRDSRGLLFGIGRLLREMRLTRKQILVPAALEIKTSPAYPLRGHELGYRPKTNSYDGFTPEMWEQYIRDLVVFGTNAVQLIPPRSDDAADSPHFPLPQMEMMVRMSQLADDYGMDVWIWYPALDEDYSKPETVDFALHEWGEVFSRLPRIDAVYVPGGDPGHTPPRILVGLLEKQAENLKRYHPAAGIWLAPEGFTVERMEVFYEIVRQDRPSWLRGLVYGPWLRVPLKEFRKLIPPEYPIRRYPDITHSLSCQYPVPDWDLAYALTEGREVINPRPTDEAKILRHAAQYSIGAITYSEGVNDDVNKIIWSSLGWNPEMEVIEILRQYSRYFIGPEYQDTFAQGLLGLERNWKGPLLINEGVYQVLRQFQEMEREASPQTLLNWRFQQGLYRAYYDAYTRARLLRETSLEDEVHTILRGAGEAGSLDALDRAGQLLDKAKLERPASDWRQRVFQLAEALFQSIRMQLSVNLYQAISVGRGANLDTLDVPLNNRQWLLESFEKIRGLESEEERLEGIHRILDWDNPGPGGFYDDLGNISNQPHLMAGEEYSADPAFFATPLVGFDCRSNWKLSWCDYIDNLYESSVKITYQHLDPAAQYVVRVVYAGAQSRDGTLIRVRLLADGDLEVHPWMVKPRPIEPIEFEVPAAATQDGELTLSCWAEPGRGGPGRGCQIGEIWLLRRTPDPN